MKIVSQLLCASALCIASAANAAPVRLDIPPQSLATALQALASKTGMQIVFRPAVVSERRAAGVKGVMEPVDALRKLLSGSSLTYVPSGNGFVVVGTTASNPAAAAFIPAAATQDVSQAVAPASPEAPSAQEIVVTAARRAQNLQKVSAAVQVINGDSIREQGLANVGQIFSNTPSIQATGQPGGFSVDVRGLGGDLPAGSTQGSSAVVFDGIYNINSIGTTVGFFDVNRIEVVPGPQSTRYGPNADGGIVNVITNDPILGKWGGHASMTLGTYGLIRPEVALNIPISSTLALRVSGAAISRDSYFHPAEGNADAQSFRAKLLFQPSNDLSIKLSYQLDHLGGTGSGSNVFPVFVNKVPVYSGDSINDLSDPWDQSPSNPQNVSHASIYQHTLAGYVTYNFNQAIALDALGSYSKLTGGSTGCIYLPPWSTTTVGYGPVVCDAQLNEFNPFHQYTGEVRLHNGAGSRLIWDIGYYHWNYVWGYTLLNAAFLTQANPVTTTTATNALYGEATYPISDRFRVIGGARESWDHRTFDFNNNGTTTPVFGINFSHFDYRAGFEYDVAPRSMVYFTASSGYRPGGLSAFNPVTQEPNSFASEVNHAFELGSKNRFFDNRLQLNLALFYYKISNYQNLDKYTGFVPPEGGGVCNNGDTRAGCQTPTFGVKAHSLGLEAQMRANITRDDVITGTATWLNAKFDKKQGTCATVAVPSAAGCWDGYNSESAFDPGAPFFFDISGAVQPHSPKFAGTIAYAHTFHFTSGARLTLGGDAFYTTGYWVNPVEDATLYGWQPSYWLENLSASYTSPDDRWSVTGFVRNLSKYAVKQSVLPATSIGDPRTAGVTLGFKW